MTALLHEMLCDILTLYNGVLVGAGAVCLLATAGHRLLLIRRLTRPSRREIAESKKRLRAARSALRTARREVRRDAASRRRRSCREARRYAKTMRVFDAPLTYWRCENAR